MKKRGKGLEIKIIGLVLLFSAIFLCFNIYRNTTGNLIYASGYSETRAVATEDYVPIAGLDVYVIDSTNSSSKILTGQTIDLLLNSSKKLTISTRYHNFNSSIFLSQVPPNSEGALLIVNNFVNPVFKRMAYTNQYTSAGELNLILKTANFSGSSASLIVGQYFHLNLSTPSETLTIGGQKYIVDRVSSNSTSSTIKVTVSDCLTLEKSCSLYNNCCGNQVCTNGICKLPSSNCTHIGGSCRVELGKSSDCCDGSKCNYNSRTQSGFCEECVVNGQTCIIGTFCCSGKCDWLSGFKCK